MNKAREIAEEISSLVTMGQRVTAQVVNDDANDTPYSKGQYFIVGSIEFTESLIPEEIQVKSEDGWAFLFEEVEFCV